MNTFVTRMVSAATVVVVLGGGGIVLSAEGPSASAGLLATTTDDGATTDEDGAGAVAPADPVAALLGRITTRPDGVVDQSGIRVILSRDPFRPVVPAPDETTTGGTDGSTSGGTDGGTTGGTDGGTTGGTDGGTTGGTDGGTSGGSAGGTVTCTGDDAETVCEGVVVTLVSITDGTAAIEVDDATYEATSGSDFAGSFRVLSVDDACVTLQYGDESFSLCIGATVLK